MSDLVRKTKIGIIGISKHSNEDVKKSKRSLQEITNNTMDRSKNKYVRKDVVEKIIKNCRGVKK